MKNMLKKINTFFSLLGIAFSAFLIVRNLIQPGYCPDFFVGHRRSDGISDADR